MENLKNRDEEKCNCSKKNNDSIFHNEDCVSNKLCVHSFEENSQCKYCSKCNTLVSLPSSHNTEMEEWEKEIEKIVDEIITDENNSEMNVAFYRQNYIERLNEIMNLHSKKLVSELKEKIEGKIKIQKELHKDCHPYDKTCNHAISMDVLEDLLNNTN